MLKQKKEEGMSQTKRMINFSLFLAVLVSIVFINLATAGMLIELPVSATEGFLKEPIETVLKDEDGKLADMRELVAVETVTAQSTITFDADTGEQNPLPMQSILQSLMQEAIMAPMMESLSSPDNPDGAVFLFAPDFVLEMYHP